MNKFDRLSLLELNKEENAVVSVIEPKIEKKEAPKKKPNILTAVFANFKQDKTVIYPAEGAVLPNLKGTMNAFVIMIFLSALFVAMWYFIDKLVFIPMAMIFLSTAMPIFIMTFYYEFDVGMKKPIGKLLMLVLVGALIYVMTKQLMSELLHLFMYSSLVDSILLPIILNVIIFIAIFIAANFFKGETVRDYFVIVSFLCMGYVICECLTKSFSKLFISGTIDSDTFYSLKVIVNNEQMLGLSMRNVLKNLLYDYILMPFMYSCWGTAYAYLVYYLIDYKKKKNSIPKSMYLLLLLITVLNILALVDTSMIYFNVVLKFITVGVSFLILIKMLNYSFDEEPPRMKPEETE